MTNVAFKAEILGLDEPERILHALPPLPDEAPLEQAPTIPTTPELLFACGAVQSRFKDVLVATHVRSGGTSIVALRREVSLKRGEVGGIAEQASVMYYDDEPVVTICEFIGGRAITRDVVSFSTLFETDDSRLALNIKTNWLGDKPKAKFKRVWAPKGVPADETITLLAAQTTIERQRQLVDKLWTATTNDKLNPEHAARARVHMRPTSAKSAK